MLKKRLIFTLLISESSFQLSRNFTLQKVGDLQWLYENYNLGAIMRSVDELMVLNVARNPLESLDSFLHIVKTLATNCFVPLSLGGGVCDLKTAYRFMESGADKLVLGKSLFEDQTLVKEIITNFGGQCVTASVDYRHLHGVRSVYIEHGTRVLPMSFEAALQSISELGVGELLLTSIDKDGTGQGYDLAAYQQAKEIVRVPIIANGGVGKFSHLIDGLKDPSISAVNTANIFNFMFNGLVDARSEISKSGVHLAKWSVE